MQKRVKFNGKTSEFSDMVVDLIDSDKFSEVSTIEIIGVLDFLRQCLINNIITSIEEKEK